MYDGKLFLDRYYLEHEQDENRAEAIHLADEAEHKRQHWSLGLSPFEQVFSIVSIVILMLVLYGILSFLL
jgi:hypothetical protein